MQFHRVGIIVHVLLVKVAESNFGRFASKGGTFARCWQSPGKVADNVGRRTR